MTWHERNQRRNAQRKANPQGWRRGHHLRSRSWIVLEDKKSGGIVAQARFGAFGNLKGKGREAEELYNALAEGTEGARA